MKHEWAAAVPKTGTRPSTNINHKGLQRTANEYARERRPPGNTKLAGKELGKERVTKRAILRVCILNRNKRTFKTFLLQISSRVAVKVRVV